MKKNISNDRKFLIERLNYIRNRANLSGRELSQILGFSVAYIAKFENGDFNIPTEVLLNAIEICKSSKEEFFSNNIFEYENNQEFYRMYEKLSPESKATIKELVKNMK